MIFNFWIDIIYWSAPDGAHQLALAFCQVLGVHDAGFFGRVCCRNATKGVWATRKKRILSRRFNPCVNRIVIWLFREKLRFRRDLRKRPVFKSHNKVIFPRESHFIMRLKENEVGDGYHDLPSKKLKKGDEILIIEGPFEGYEATLFSQNAEDRVVVLLKIAEKYIKVQLNQSLIEKIT